MYPCYTKSNLRLMIRDVEICEHTFLGGVGLGRDRGTRTAIASEEEWWAGTCL